MNEGLISGKGGSGSGTYVAEAWYYKTIWVSSVVHGSLVVDSVAVTMRDSNGQVVFAIPYDQCKGVKYRSGRLKIQSKTGNYIVALFDPKSIEGWQLAEKGVYGIIKTERSGDKDGKAIEGLIRSNMLRLSGCRIGSGQGAL